MFLHRGVEDRLQSIQCYHKLMTVKYENKKVRTPSSFVGTTVFCLIK